MNRNLTEQQKENLKNLKIWEKRIQKEIDNSGIFRNLKYLKDAQQRILDCIYIYETILDDSKLRLSRFIDVSELTTWK